MDKIAKKLIEAETNPRPNQAQLRAMSRKELEKRAWAATHRDFKGNLDGEKSIMHNDPKTGGSTLGMLSKVPDEVLFDKINPSWKNT